MMHSSVGLYGRKDIDLIMDRDKDSDVDEDDDVGEDIDSSLIRFLLPDPMVSSSNPPSAKL